MERPFSTADLWDEYYQELSSLAAPWRDFGHRRCFAGPVETLHTQSDVQAIRDTLDEPGEGRVLLVDARGSLEFALLGDKLARRAMDNGWTGVILFGAVRDTASLSRMEVGIKALGTTAKRPFRPIRPALRGSIVQIKSVSVSRSSHVYCDEDDILVANRELLF